MVPAAAAVVGFFLDDVAEAVEARHYPRCRRQRSRAAAQVADALRFFGLVVAANLVALVIYLMVPPLAPSSSGWSTASCWGGSISSLWPAPARARAAAALGQRHPGRIWAAGTAMAVPLWVPLLNLLVPILGVAVFTHQFHRLAGDA